jgi:1-acyl-sn-glycerol-3-phosphate acyltransferase
VKKIISFVSTIRLLLITFDISIRTIVQYWRGPMKMTRAWSDKTIQKWSQRLLNAAKVDLHVHNNHAIQFQPGQSYIVMCNHTSHFDIPISLVALSGWSVRMLAKKELYQIPLFGKAMLSADFPMIDRKNRRQSIKDLAHARDLMKDGIAVWVAPEGTRSMTGELGEFKRGAFLMAIDAKAMIIPMGISGAQKILPAQSMGLSLGERIDVFIGEPIDASEYTSKEKDVLLDRVRVSIAALTSTN